MKVALGKIFCQSSCGMFRQDYFPPRIELLDDDPDVDWELFQATQSEVMVHSELRYRSHNVNNYLTRH